MRVIATIILVLVLAWMFTNYMDNRPKRTPAPIEADLTEPRTPEAMLQSTDRRYINPQQKARNTEQVLMDGANKRREEIEAATQ
jgi:hypothetical protein